MIPARTRRFRAIFAVLLSGALVAAACSGDDGGSGSASPGETEVTAESDAVFALAGGCSALTLDGSGDAVQASDGGWVIGTGTEAATPFTMQATALGRYLMYGPGGEMIAAEGADGVVATTEPGPLADWTVAPDDDGLTVTNLETGAQLGVTSDQELSQAGDDGARWSFVDADGCEAFPDIDPGATGEPFVGEGVDAPARGFLDAHTHVSAFSFLGGSFHCGRPWSPYGVTVALTDCPSHLDGGVGQAADSIFSAGLPGQTHETDGWPTFEGWPKPDSLTHEGTYWRWIERAWRGGLRVMVNHLVDNRALCETYPENDGTVCNDMDNVRDQAADMVELEGYIDAQFGGPGKGFFRLVDSPEDARQVINDGKLAVVLGVEVSEVLDCGLDEGAPTCDEAQIDAGLDELHDLGVRSVFPVHKFDNALGGTKFDGGLTGLIVNFGNQLVTGDWWDPATCEAGATPDNTVESPAGVFSVVAQAVAPVFGESTPTDLRAEPPAYDPDPHCNTKGLTELGAYVVNGLVDRGMIVETDHLSAQARSEVFDILEERDYSGVITSHGWGDEPSQERLVALGGVVSPYAGSLPGFSDNWRAIKDAAPAEFVFGLGFGTDTNGLGGQPKAREDSAENPVVYPYETFDGATMMEQQVSGERIYDVNVDGVAHYGLFPDWIEDMRVLEGPEIVEDLAQGAEAYLQMWERAEQHS